MSMFRSSPGKPAINLLTLTPAFLLSSALLLAGFRAAFLWRYADAASLAGMGQDIVHAFVLGLRFDLKVACVATLLWLIPLALLQGLLSRHPARAATIARWRDAGLLFWLCVQALLSVVQHYYFGFYQTPFTPMVFGLADDDTVNVLRTVWQDYPVLRALLGVALLGWLGNWLTHRLAARISRVWPPSGWSRGWRRGLLNTLLAIIVVLLARGSLATFPLNKEASWFSLNPMLNNAARNAPQTLYDAWRSRQDDSTKIERADEGLKAHGFDNVFDAATAAAGHPVHSIEAVENLFWRTSPASNSNARPHVVFVLMESWSGYMLSFDDPDKTDLLGRLRPLTKSDYWFHNFLPSQGGTHASMEALLFNTPITPLTLGAYRKIPFDTNITWPFRQAGYDTVLVTGGSALWRDLRDAMRYQGFDKIYDKADISARYREARSNDWGVPDEYLFRYAHDLLQQADREGRHLLLIVQTTTNHPPFQLPPERRVPLDTTQLRAISRLPPETVDNVAQTYRYSSDQLAGFVGEIKSGTLADHTLIGAAGDHNMRYFFGFKRPRDSYIADFVASYMYLPPAMRPARGLDMDAFYSHQDFFPTFMALALPPGIRYFAGGENMLAPQRTQDSAYCWYSGLYAREGYVSGKAKNPAAFTWQAGRLLAPAATATPVLMEKFRRADARLALQDWWIRRRALGQQDAQATKH